MRNAQPVLQFLNTTDFPVKLYLPVYCHHSSSRDSVEEEAFSSLLKVLSQLYDELQAASRDDQDVQSVALQLQLTAECFRAQRNSCVQSTRNQGLLRYTANWWQLIVECLCQWRNSFIK